MKKTTNLLMGLRTRSAMTMAVAVLSVALFSCGGNKKTEVADEQTLSAGTEKVYELDSLLTVADTQVDDTVKVIGYVTHTCKHSGKRCFIVGESQTGSMRVEAKGEIGGFNRELVGSKLEITGVLKERRLTKEYIDQLEKDTELKQKEDGAAESCAAELSNINAMRQWMKDHTKDFYAIYYMDGLNFTTLD
ncbi:MAG: hypothetical protein LBN93_07420 [Candidatus Symbiothrix sp.]|jgi:hypothetical protein|nr:hypothetical protein [Candidatus Symbiothrix sp.]